VFGHGFLLNRGEKMSKSVGNVADPLELSEAFGVDQLRYFLLSEVTFGNDGSYSPEAIVQKSNSDLANSFGNLAQRTLSFIAKNLDGRVPQGERQAEDEELLALVRQATSIEFPAAMNEFALSQAIEAWMRAVFACNAYIDAQAPWALRKTDPARMEAVLATLYEAIGDLAIAIQPVIPVSAAELLDQMGLPPEQRGYVAIRAGEWFQQLAESGFTLAPPKPLFPRLELPAEA
jgi:methionyl-tRNA synthetase